MYWSLKVSEYGKIKSAEVEVAPLTLFVGDNNSGKSYLMSLVWGIRNLGMLDLLRGGMGQEGEEENVLMDWLRKQVAAAWEKGVHAVRVNEVADVLQSVLNRSLKHSKNNLVSTIFNNKNVKIGEMQIELKELEKTSLIFKRVNSEADESTLWLSMENKNNLGEVYQRIFSDEKLVKMNNSFDWAMICVLFSLLTGIPAGSSSSLDNDIYLPAARTGFMLTKDIVNKVGRNTVFNIGIDQEKISPFIRPINQFLDVMNDLAYDSKGDVRFDKITEYLEGGMAEGTVGMSALPNREVVYMPIGSESGLPLRVVSAVVTELSPLILILKHKNSLNTLFYEEPEMCLHPQLQQKMARAICQLSNAQLGMVVTTHSDIILQHINNMICLAGREDAETICRKLGYTEDDLLNAKDVKVYQFTSRPGEKTKVEELMCGENGFAVPTFNEALDRIMEEAYLIQE